MSEQWLCVFEGRQLGPLSLERLKQLAAAGRLKPTDSVRRSHDVEWLPAGDLPELFPANASQPNRPDVPKPHVKPRTQHQTPASIPRGKALVSTSSTVRTPVASEIPVGKTVGVAAAPTVTDDVASPALPLVVAERRTPGHRPVSKRSKSAMPLLVGGGLAVVVLGMGVVLVLSGAFRGSVEVTSSDPNAPPPLASSGGEPATKGANTLAATALGGDATPRERSTEELIKNVKTWHDVTKMKQLKLAPLSVAVSAVYLAADASGKPLVASATPASPYLCVKLTVANAPGAAPLKYAGWSGEALLIDESGKQIAPATDGKSQSIPPGGEIEDTLVFALTSAEFEKLRLLLPKQTVSLGEGHFALEVPRQALGRGVAISETIASTPEISARVAASDDPTQINAAASKATESATATPASSPAVATSAAAKPKSDDDIDRTLEKLEAKAKMLDKADSK